MRALAILGVVLALACGKPSNDLPAEAWGTSDYVTAGVPAPDHRWTDDEFVRAAGLMTQLGTDHPERLPRFEGARSGEVFGRLVEPGTDEPSAPIGDRFNSHLQRFKAAHLLSKRYMSALAPRREWIELLGVTLRESVALAPLLEPLIASLGPDDPERAKRLQQFETMRTSWGGMLVGAVTIAGDTRVPERDRIAVMQHVTAALPVLFPRVPADSQRLIRDHVTKLVTSLSAGPLHDAVIAAQQRLPS